MRMVKRLSLSTTVQDNLSDDKLAKYFERLGPIGYRDIRKNGQLSGRLYYRVGYGYRDGT